MLVSHTKQFIYTKTVKTAGTSVESYFEPYCMGPGEWTPDHYRDAYVSESGIIGFRGEKRPPGVLWYHHMPAKKIRALLGEEIWSKYYKFCVIRDPFDKAVSAFYYFWKNRESSRMTKNYSFAKRLSLFMRNGKSKTVAGEFELWLEAGNLPLDRDKYTIEGRVCVDEFIRYESLNEDLARVSDVLKVSFDPERLPTFKSGIRDTAVDLGELYSKRSIEIVSNLYDFEIGHFGYRPPSPR